MSPQPLFNGEAIRARQVKAHALVEALIVECGAPEAALRRAERATATDWRMLARAAAVRAPSPETTAAVVSILRLRCQPPSDPLEGLPR